MKTRILKKLKEVLGRKKTCLQVLLFFSKGTKLYIATDHNLFSISLRTLKSVFFKSNVKNFVSNKLTCWWKIVVIFFNTSRNFFFKTTFMLKKQQKNWEIQARQHWNVKEKQNCRPSKINKWNTIYIGQFKTHARSLH